ncbi:MAG: hypothetical protein CMN58_02280 [Solibacterales bacterium]|nr:hypothetical protein [Bryobacterales bacterium]|tara:strand:+ start:43739 stop:45475 length:1737 start_codon:yes stop_codon:yes gene_type:complete
MILYLMPNSNDEQFVQQRLLLACVLSALAVGGYFYVVGPTVPPSSTTVATSELQNQAPDRSSVPVKKDSKNQPAAMTRARSDDLNLQVAKREQEIVVETETYRVTFSNRGATVTSWILKNYNSADGQEMDLLSHGTDKSRAFTLVRSGGEAITALDDALFKINSGSHMRAGPTSVVFVYDDGRYSASKTFRFESQGYVVEIESAVTLDDIPQEHLLTWANGFGDTRRESASLYSTTFYYDRSENSLIRNVAGDLGEDSSTVSTGPFRYVGVDDLYFTAVFMPLESGEEIRIETGETSLPTYDEEYANFVTLAAGGAETNRFQCFIGPKIFPSLGSIRPELQEVVDFGWAGFIAKPLYWMLLWTHDNVVANYGWSIVLLTVFINIVLFPVKWKSSGSMKRMQAVAPLMKQINDKYKGLKFNDPKKQQQQKEMQALYKKYQVNPLGGCLPMLIQMPFFFAFYGVLSVAIEIRQADWLWVADLSQPEQLSIRILPIAMMASQFWIQSLTPTPSTDAAQARIMKFMPLMFGFLFYSFQSGLVLYWLTSNLAGILQQVFINRMPAPADLPKIEQPRRHKKKKR